MFGSNWRGGTTMFTLKQPAELPKGSISSEDHAVAFLHILSIFPAPKSLGRLKKVFP
jgi:hypothetical protein